MKIAVIGLGLIGGSIARDLHRTGFASEIIGVETNPEHVQEAMKLGLCHRHEELIPAVQEADLVVIAIPVDKIEKILPAVLDNINPNTTVTDVGSTKKKICRAVEGHPNRTNFVPSHPMSGTENSGPKAAVEGLFEGKISIICDLEKSRPQHVALVEKMYHAIGMKLAYMSSDDQDHSTAFVSHLPHATAFALANAVLDKEEREVILDLASGGFQSAVRLAKSSPEMWGPIFQQNKKYLLEALEVYMRHLEDLKVAIETDEDRMMKIIKNANGIRQILDQENSHMIKNEETIVKLYTKK